MAGKRRLLGGLLGLVLVACSLPSPGLEQPGDGGDAGPRPSDGGASNGSGGSGGIVVSGKGGGTSTSMGGGSGVGGAVSNGGSKGDAGGVTSSGGDASTGGGATGGAPGNDAGDAGSGSPLVVHVSVAGQPAANVPVVIDGVVHRTNAQGTFQVPDAAAVYTAVLVDHAGGATYVTQYVGLTTRSPFFFVTPQGPGNNATLGGSLSGGGAFPNASNQRAGVAVVAGSEVQAKQVLGAGTGPAYGPLDLAWQGTLPFSATLMALRWTVDGSGMPAAYNGWATQAVSVPIGSKTNADLALAAVDSRLVTGSIDVPSGLTITSKLLRVGGIQGFNVVNDPSQATILQYRLPTLKSAADQTFHVFADSSSGAAHSLRHVDDSTTSIDVSMLPVPELGAPADSATGITLDTAFTFTAAAGLYDVGFHDDAGTLFIDVITAATTVKIPDLTASGIALAKGGHYAWSVVVNAPPQTPDDSVLPESPYETYGYRSDAATNERTFVLSTK